jgi:hypothetical protein
MGITVTHTKHLQLKIMKRYNLEGVSCTIRSVYSRMKVTVTD